MAVSLSENRKLNVLIIYHTFGAPVMRTSILDHLYSFRKYSRHNCIYINVAIFSLPRFIGKIKWDLVIFHTSFICQRFNKDRFQNVVSRVNSLKTLKCPKAVFPQDEFINADLLCNFINDYSVGYVFSVAPESEWKKIYRNIDNEKVKIFRVLTGYLDENTIERISRLKSKDVRLIDIGYRARRAQYWWGKFGLLKTRVAEKVKELGLRDGLVIDIATGDRDVFHDMRWYKFLMRCKYTIGVEGGASILDFDGTLKEKTEAYLKKNPQASFEEVEKACFPSLDGTLRLNAISPRHLEACVTKTCQILLEGKYNGILKPGRHYIELKSDFSNVEEVVHLVKEDKLRSKIVETAYTEIVASGKFNYDLFVKYIFSNTNPGGATRDSEDVVAIMGGFQLGWLKFCESMSWPLIRVGVLVREFFEILLPDKVMLFLDNFMRNMRWKKYG